MEKINLHQQRLIALVIAVISVIFIFLQWWLKYPDGFQNQSTKGNGFSDTGFLSFAGIIGVLIASFLGNKSQPFDKQTKMIALGSFGAMVLGAVIHLFFVSGMSGEQQTNIGMLYYTAKAGIGMWLTLVAGVIGLVLVSGIADKIIKSQGAPAAAQPPKPPPPPPPKS